VTVDRQDCRGRRQSFDNAVSILHLFWFRPSYNTCKPVWLAARGSFNSNDVNLIMDSAVIVADHLGYVKQRYLYLFWNFVGAWSKFFSEI